MNKEKNEFFTEDFPSPEQIMRDVEKDGYHIYQNAIKLDIYNKIRDFWLEYFSSDKPELEVVRGGLVLGEENFNAYTDTEYWKLFRHFDFLWNQPTHEISTKIAVELHKKRNLALGLDEEFGLKFTPDCDGIYISTSYYPPNIGTMKPHEDGYIKNKDFPLLHFMLPITFKGVDYEKGGLMVWDKNDKKIDVDEIMKPGSILFYLGQHKHGVETIIPYKDKGTELGRLAIFAIPVVFKKQKAQRENIAMGKKQSKVLKIFKKN